MSVKAKFFEYFPCVERFFKAMDEDRLEGADIIELYGPRGCLKKRVAEEYAIRQGMPYSNISWLDIRVRADKVLNRMLCPRADGKKRIMIVRAHGAFLDREKLLGLLEYTEYNQFIVVSDVDLKIGGVRFPMFPLGDDAVAKFLRKSAPKCAWRYDKALVRPVLRYTGGNPAALFDVVRMTRFAKTPGKVIEMIENTKEYKESEKLYGVLTAGEGIATVAKAIDAALHNCGWATITEHIQQRLATDMLNPEALPPQALENGAWQLLDSFNPTSKNEFIAGCFRIAQDVKQLVK